MATAKNCEASEILPPCKIGDLACCCPHVLVRESSVPGETERTFYYHSRASVLSLLHGGSSGPCDPSHTQGEEVMSPQSFIMGWKQTCALCPGDDIVVIK